MKQLGQGFYYPLLVSYHLEEDNIVFDELHQESLWVSKDFLYVECLGLGR